MTSPVIFLHIPKTGGATLRDIISRHFRPSAIFKQRSPEREGRRAALEELRSLPPERLEQIRLVRGHFWFGIHELLPGPSTYITVLRDPIDRALSLFYYRVRRQGLTASLEQWVAEGRDFDLDNGQTRRLSGIEVEDLAFGECSPEVLERAKGNLADHFAVAGLTERFDETLILLRRTFGWRKLFYVPTNVGTNRPPRGAISAEALRSIEEINRFDTELYSFAQSRFEDLLARQEPAIGGELRRFRIQNALFHRVRPVVGPAWRLVRRLGGGRPPTDPSSAGDRSGDRLRGRT